MQEPEDPGQEAPDSETQGFRGRRRSLEGAKWKPTEIIVASGSGFDPDGLHFAREYSDNML